LNPFSNDREPDRERRDLVWDEVSRHLDDVRPQPRWTAPRRAGVGVAVAAVIALTVFGVVPGASSRGAAAAELRQMAGADAAAAALPTLSADQYYYQESAISLTCEFGSPTMGASEPLLRFIARGTVERWTNSLGSGMVVTRAAPLGADGSHFASVAERRRWLSDGKPFIPCALKSKDNYLSNNAANFDETDLHHLHSATVYGYGGFGHFITSASSTNQLLLGAWMNDLPADSTQLSQMLAAGEINVDGSTSSSPQSCPVNDGTSPATSGCSATEQMSIIEQLLQLPDASAKLGATLYRVALQLPGVTMAGTTSNAFGRRGSAIMIPTGDRTTVEVVIDPRSGELLSCAVLTAPTAGSTAYRVTGQMSYGPIVVVRGAGMLPHRVDHPSRTSGSRHSISGSR
jgi:hypothetical protein